MPNRLDRKRRMHSRRTPLLILATVVTAVLVTGCGGSSTTTTAVRTGRTTTPASNTVARSGPTRSLPAAPTSVHPSALGFARCMRANGVPNFPDPAPGGNFYFNQADMNRSAPAFRAAQQKCQAYMPPGPAPPGSTTHPSPQTLAQLLHIAECMHQHGVPQFPDPRTSVPRNVFSSGVGVITNYMGAILLFPSTLNMHAPAYRQAAAACGTLAASLGSGPHPHG